MATAALHGMIDVRRNAESQRDSATKPRVARNELPWVNTENEYNPERVAASCDHGGFKKAGRSTGVYYGARTFQSAATLKHSTAPKNSGTNLFSRCCGLESPRSVLESARQCDGKGEIGRNPIEVVNRRRGRPWAGGHNPFWIADGQIL